MANPNTNRDLFALGLSLAQMAAYEANRFPVDCFDARVLDAVSDEAYALALLADELLDGTPASVWQSLESRYNNARAVYTRLVDGEND